MPVVFFFLPFIRSKTFSILLDRNRRGISGSMARTVHVDGVLALPLSQDSQVSLPDNITCGIVSEVYAPSGSLADRGKLSERKIRQGEDVEKSMK